MALTQESEPVQGKSAGPLLLRGYACFSFAKESVLPKRTAYSTQTGSKEDVYCVHSTVHYHHIREDERGFQPTPNGGGCEFPPASGVKPPPGLRSAGSVLVQAQWAAFVGAGRVGGTFGRGCLRNPTGAD